MPLNLQKEEWPLWDLLYGRHVHEDGLHNWGDQAHLHKRIQEGAQGDEIAYFTLIILLYRLGDGINPLTHVLA